MQTYKDETSKTFPGKVLPAKEMRMFQQTPSDNMHGTKYGIKPDVPPHELFHLFTAGIIIQDKVFIR